MDNSERAPWSSRAERHAVLRERLGSSSWFMRFLKEPITRQANREYNCTGRFWEGRFKTQALLDDPAVLACVDLNPLRAGVADSPEDGPHTSLRRRTFAGEDPQSTLQPVAASIRDRLPDLTLRDYGNLVHWTGSELHDDLENSTKATMPRVISRIGLRSNQWLLQVPATESHYWRAVGTSQALLELAARIGQRWIRGIGNARALEKVPIST